MNEPHFELLDYQDTPLGVLCLRRRELLSRPGTVVTEVTLDHVFLMSSYHTDSERALASRGLALHDGDSLDVIVGGLGLGFTAKEALRDPRVSGVEVIELLPQVIEWLDQEWIPDASELKADARLRVTQADVFDLLLGDGEVEPVDLVLLDVDHAPDELLTTANDGFYRPEGLRRARRRLRPGGLLGLWSSFPSDDFSAVLSGVFDDVTVETVTWWNDLVDEEKEDTLFFARRA